MSSPDESRPIRIAFGITDLDVGGAENALCEIVTRLDPETWEPVVFCLAGRGANADRLEQAGVPVTCLDAGGWWDVRILGRLTSALRECSPRLLQTFLFHANVVGRIAGRRAGVERIVSGVRVADRRAAWRHWIDRWTASRADHHVCVSRAVAEFTKRKTGIPEERLSVIPNGVEFERFARAAPADLAEFGIPPAAKVLLFVGRLDPQKNPELAIDGFEQLAADRAEWHLVMVGDGPLRARLIEQRRGSAVADRIHLAGHRRDVPSLMRAASVLVLPSRFEGMPNVLLEGMAAGLPAVVSDVEGVGEVLPDGLSGYRVEPGNLAGLVKALSTLMDDDTLRGGASRMLQAIAREKFTWDLAARAYEDLFRRILGIDSQSTAGPCETSAI